MWVWVSFAVLQMCVWSTHMKLTFRPSSTSSAHSVFTALWCGFVVKLNRSTFYRHQTPSWFRLVWTNSPVFIPPGMPGYRDRRHNCTNNTQTPLYLKYYGHVSSPQTPGLYRIQGIDCTILTRNYAPPFCWLGLATSMGGLIIEYW